MSTASSKYGFSLPEGSDPADLPDAISNLIEGDAGEGRPGVEEIIGRSGVAKRNFVDAAQSTTSGSYVLLGTPDRVQNIVVPAGALLKVGYQALWKADEHTGAQAAIFLNGVQLRYRRSGSSTGTLDQSVYYEGTNVYRQLSTAPYGLAAGEFNRWDHNVEHTSDVTTGQAVASPYGTGSDTVYDGGLCNIFLAAGTYDVSVRFKYHGIGGGGVFVKERKLWVELQEYEDVSP